MLPTAVATPCTERAAPVKPIWALAAASPRLVWLLVTFITPPQLEQAKPVTALPVAVELTEAS